MTKVAILPVPTTQGQLSYRAVSGEKRSSGLTPGAALDALTAQFSADETSTLVIVQSFRPDQFFSVAQQQRLAELMAQWRIARDSDLPFPPEAQTELATLVEMELQAATARATALADDAGR